MKAKEQDSLTKWLRYGFDRQIFEDFPEFALFLLKTPLASQMKITGEVPFLYQGEPSITSEGQPLCYSALVQRFFPATCRVTGERVLIERVSNRIFTYLGGGQGFIPYNPYKNFFESPVVHLSDLDRQNLWQGAARFGRSGDHVIQIISCATKRRRFFARRHVYLRLVTKEGAVYSFGFNYKKPFSLPYRNHQGLLRSPDIWEYHNRCQKMVTSLFITEAEKQKLESYVMSQFSPEDRPVFNLFAQNCALFVREALAYCCELELPTKHTYFSKTMHALSQRGEGMMRLFFPRTDGLFAKIFKPIHDLVSSCVEVSLSVILSLVGLVLGAGSGIRGKRLSHPAANEELPPPAASLDWWLDLDAKEIHFPSLVQKWQTEQPSTEIYQNALKLAF